MLPEINRFGARCLRERAHDADTSDPATKELLDTMWAFLVADGGVGLAAPQLGVSQRLVVIRDPSQPEGQQRLDLVNPVIAGTFGPDEPFEEGCLSFPGLYTMVTRPKGIELIYEVTGNQGTDHQLRGDGLVARVVQHEVDHLDGVLFIDHLGRFERYLLAPRLLLIMVQHFWRQLSRGLRKDQR